VSVVGRARDARITAVLLTWFRARVRDVPWRNERDPYRIWIAEVMAQQTRLGTMGVYYERFLRRFPDVRSLAAAELDEVLKLWEGLGYYARARNLWKAARVVSSGGGTLPTTAAGLRTLPGIGPYTAGAIASLAFGLPEPAVDGNARRVLARLFDSGGNSAAELERFARNLLSAATGSPADVNQALMDLGADVCLPRHPMCVSCPLTDHCLAKGRGTTAERPLREPVRRLPHQVVAVGLVWDHGRLLIARRPEDGLLGGLWEFPGGKVEPGESPEEAVRRELHEEMKIAVEVGALAGRVRHSYSHFRITLYAFHARRTGGEPSPGRATAWRWATPVELDGYAFPAANRKILLAVRDQGTPYATRGMPA